MNTKPTILVIFGISGDLAKRYILPAISAIYKNGMLPHKFKIVGLTRQNDFNKNDLINKTSVDSFVDSNLEIRKNDMAKVSDLLELDSYLKSLEKNFGEDTERVFYLSVPPEASRTIISLLGESGLSKVKNTKILLEKPFGVNLDDAIKLVSEINKYFKKDSVYRIDHYMAKEIVQNIIIFRDGNSLFKKTWNNNFIERIDIYASEKLGIEGRSNFYEQSGALRDMVQSHLLELLALILMELPESNDLSNVPSLRLEALKNLYIKDINSCRRGQYLGYKEDVGNPFSNTETFVSLSLESKDERWIGVPITLTTGKAIEGRYTEVKISYKKDRDHESNELVIRIQPSGGIRFNMWAKYPGYEYRVRPHNLSFNFEDHYGSLPNAYEQVIYSAMNSLYILFTSGEEVIESWRVLDPIQKKWQENSQDIFIYKKGESIDELT